MSKARNKEFSPLVCVLLSFSCAGAGLVYLATYRFGPGLSTDAVLNLSGAANLMQGRGFVDLYGNAITQWPPLYAALLAILSSTIRMDIFLVGWHLNALAFGLIIFFSGILFYKTFPARPSFAYAGSLIVLTALGLIQIAANIASDPLFLLLVVLFLLFSRKFADSHKWEDLFWMGTCACLASFQRYAGVALILTGSVFVFHYYRTRPLQALLRSSLFLFFSGLPIVGWGLFHNHPVNGTLFGTNGMTDAAGDFYLLIEKLLYWFLPYNIIRIATPPGLIAIILLGLILFNRSAQWRNWFNLLIADSQLANSIFVLIYGGMLVFYVSYLEHRNLESQRIHIVLLPSLLIIIFGAIQELIPPRPGSSKETVKYRVLAALFILWILYPASKIQEYLQRSAGVEPSGNNIYNTADLRDSDFLGMAQSLSGTDQNIYSNYEAAGWFYLRRDILGLPRLDKKGGTLDEQAVANFRKSIGPDGGGYIIWFRTIHLRDNLPEPFQLYQMANIEPVFLSNAGDIYRIISSQP